MRPTFLAWILLAWTWVALIPSVGLAQTERRDEVERWVPSLAVSFGAMAQPSGGSVNSGPVIGPPLSDGGCEERHTSQPGVRTPGLCQEPIPSDPILTPNVKANDTTAAALLGLSLELMSPGLIELPTRPRLFAHGDTSFVFAFKRKLAGDGDPGAMRVPAPPRTVKGSVSNVTEDTISGQGNRSFSELSSPIFSAGAGVALSFDVWGRRIRLKPSFEYMVQEIEFTGQANRAIQIQGSGQERPSKLENYRLVSLSATKKRVHHGVGGGLEVEADTQRLGPFVLSAFAGGRIYHVLGDLDEKLSSDRNQVGASFPGESVTWRFEPENILWQGSVGLRFRYLPE